MGEEHQDCLTVIAGPGNGQEGGRPEVTHPDLEESSVGRMGTGWRSRTGLPASEDLVRIYALVWRGLHGLREVWKGDRSPAGRRGEGRMGWRSR